MDMVLPSVLRGLATYQTIIFILLGIGILVYLRMFVIGVSEWKKSIFGLERRFAQRRLIAASTGLVLLFLLLVGEFLLVTLIEPRMPAQSSEVLAEMNPSVEVTSTLPTDVESGQSSSSTENNQETAEQSNLVFECVEDHVEITYPNDGDRISGSIEIMGSVNVDNFGSYKYEYSPTGNINWTTIAAGNQMKLDESIGLWYTSALTPGRYLLRLVPLDNAGEALTPCIVTVEVYAEE
ncbi:MAG: hypothetical protein GX142_10005 [Chloroflexi bacterium]|jgi:hypothetical protein|nr:hypothetical protein [Chloroflexota bacterium]